MPKLSKVISQIASSPIADMMTKARAMSKNGEEIIDLTVGELDFDTPFRIREAGKKAIDNGYTRYTPADGLDELKIKIAAHYDVGKDNISVTPGAKAAVFATLHCIADPGDEVVIPAPYWPCFYQAAVAAGTKPVTILPQEGTLLVSAEQIINVCTDKTSVIILNSPCNPSGQMYQSDELKKILDFCLEKDIFCLFDSTYGDLCFQKEKAPSPFDYGSKYLSCTIAVGSASKAWAMSGWRIGWCIGPALFAKAMAKYMNNCLGSPCTVSQIAFLEALQTSVDTEQIKEACAKRCEVVERELSKSDFLSLIPTDGGFYVFVRLLQKRITDVEFCSLLLEKEHVAVVAGSAFGLPGYFRLSCTKSECVLKEACRRIRKYASKND